MKINEAIKDLWSLKYFESHKKTGIVEKKLLSDYGITCSNITMQLISCKAFLRRTPSGWIQKNRYETNLKSKGKTVDYFSIFNIHPDIKKASRKLYDDKHYTQAIFEAFKKINNIVKSKSGLDEDGKTLMMNAFNEVRPVLRFNNLVNTTERNVQEGYKFLLAGSMIAIRNPKAHDEIHQKDSIQAMKYIILASLLAGFLDGAKKST